MKKIDNFLKAVLRLDEAEKEYKSNNTNTVIRDGLIQRFEFTFELSWKAMKEYMEDQGIKKEFTFPKEVLKTAYENHMIGNQEVWLDMLRARNSTSHIYDDKIAEEISINICNRFLFAFKELELYFKSTVL